MESCGIYNRTLSDFYGHQDASYPLRAVFVQEPPEDLRKSNFFKFTVAFRGGSDEAVDIESAYFVRYINETHEMDIRNGIKYNVLFRYPNGTREQRDLFITLVDAATTEPIRYEGQDDSPKMRRVLLTHETICSRCSQQKSCGNKNEAPSDPLIVEKGSLKFFLKCNQNCLKSAGNPKDMRRFSMALSFIDITHDKSHIVAVSKKMFVHNNSKHSRKRKKDMSLDTCSLPVTKLFELFPTSGTSGTRIAIFGDNFYPGVQVYMGSLPILSEVVSERLIHARVPYLTTPSCPVVIRQGNQHYTVGVFHYEFPSHSQVGCVHPRVGVRGEELLLFGRELSSPDLTIVCNGMPLETKVVEKVGVVAIIPPSIGLGMVEIGVFRANHILFWFRYQIQDRNHPGFSQTYGVLTLCANGQTPSHVLNEAGYNEVRMVSLPGDFCFSSALSSSSSSNNSSSSLSPYTPSSYYTASSSSPEMPSLA